MATRELTSRQKAATLVPIALLSGGWVVSMLGFGSADAAGHGSGDHRLPDGTTVPSRAIDAPANLPVSGQIAPGVPNGDANTVADGASASGIPSAALSAYQRAAQVIDAADTTCRLPWELVAAIGRVESDHGRYDGNVLGDNGVSTPGVYGPTLDGQNGTSAIKDTDAGELDHDTTWDRAVGPLQFIPSTWQVVKVDGDGDGQRNPQDIDDASLASAVYLCSGTDDLSTTEGQKASVFRYNHSDAYVDLVLRIMQAYQAGDFTTVPDNLPGSQVFTSNDLAPAAAGGKTPRAKQSKPGSAATPSSQAPATSSAPNQPKQNPANTGGGGGGGGGTGGGGGAPSVPATTKPAVPSPVASAVSSAAAPVVHLLTDAEAETFCNNQLPANIKNLVPNAVATCKGQISGKSQSQADGAIGGIIASLSKLLPSLP